MNLQALYDLKERLEAAAISGTGLMQEDFRLRRAVEALAPLAGVNPVFGKIDAAARALLNAPQEERSGRLMDVLSLVDAVVYTQGISNISGEMEPLEPGPGTCVEIPYGQLQPLLTALGGTGSGRTSLIRDYWTEHPDYFTDFRVLPHVVGALGDHYAELADLIGQILMAQGPEILPLLKQGFAPDGKAEMARRVRLMAKLAGEGENEWYVRILPDSKKEVRIAVIQALGLCQDNARLLLELCQSERGKLRDAAMRSLAMMEEPECVEFLRKELQKKPEHALFLKGVGSTAAADLTAEALKQYLEKLRGKTHYTCNELDALVILTNAICGKYSAQVRLLWQQISMAMDELAHITPDDQVHSTDLSVAEHFQRCMMRSILCNPCPEMIGLVQELAERNRPWFLCCGFLGDLMIQKPESVFQQFSNFLIPDGADADAAACDANTQRQILSVFAACNWDHKGFCLEYRDYDALTGAEQIMRRSIPGLDSRWGIYLANPENRKEVEVYDLAGAHHPRKTDMNTDHILMRMIDPKNPELCEICGQYFRKRVRLSGALSEYMDALLRCGWKDWRGMIVQSVRKENQLRYHWVLEVLERLPMTKAEKAAELREMKQMVENGSVSVWGRIWSAKQTEMIITEQIEIMIAQLEENPDSRSDQRGN